MKKYISVSKLKGIVVASGNSENKEMALSLNALMMQAGFIMSESLLNIVSSMAEDDIEEQEGLPFRVAEVCHCSPDLIGQGPPGGPMHRLRK